MIRKTVRQFRRHANTWNNGSNTTHTERVRRETWWLFAILPLYSRDWIVADTM
jgi:hypothetical protein